MFRYATKKPLANENSYSISYDAVKSNDIIYEKAFTVIFPESAFNSPMDTIGLSGKEKLLML